MSEVKSFCYFEAEGLNHGKIIKKLHLQKVVLRGVISKGVRLKFGVNASDKQKVVDLFTALNYNYKIIKYTGAAAFKDFLRYRFGLLIGAAAVIVFIAVMSGFVLDVKVNLPFRAREAADVLAEFGVREGGSIPRWIVKPSRNRSSSSTAYPTPRSREGAPPYLLTLWKN